MTATGEEETKAFGVIAAAAAFAMAVTFFHALSHLLPSVVIDWAPNAPQFMARGNSAN